MHALIDGDVLCYAFGNLTKRSTAEADFCPDTEEGEILPFNVCWAGVERLIDKIADRTCASKVTIFLSSQDKPTWRHEIATILPYKGNRKGTEKPEHWSTIRTNLTLHYDHHIAEGIEADDAMSIMQYASVLSNTPETSHTVICTVDKDLDMVPGWHYRWPVGNSKEKPMWCQSYEGGLKVFYKQLCTGDSTDNIIGLFGVGPKAAILSKIDQAKDEREMLRIVYEAYRQRFGNYAEQFMNETGRLLWMQALPYDRWTVPKYIVEEYA